MRAKMVVLDDLRMFTIATAQLTREPDKFCGAICSSSYALSSRPVKMQHYR